MEARPIPAFYCCYLLRSCPKEIKSYRRSLYVGSTPNPLRRLAQHNGDSKGGAVRTSKCNLRPWEMTVIVTGFPSKIAALQFEWAWHNTHITKKIADEQRITIPIKKSGRTRKKTVKPYESLPVKLANLHLLLRVPSFARWPLQVRFFCQDVYETWQRWNERVDGSISRHIQVLLDLKQDGKAVDGSEVPMSTHTKGERKREAIGTGGLDGLDIGYSGLKDNVEKSRSLLAGDEALSCAVCLGVMGPPLTMALVCPCMDCRMTCHMTCLATRFRMAEGKDASVTPTSGLCPICKRELQWVDLVKEMSLRVRGEKEVAQLMKKPRERKLKAPKTVKLSASSIDPVDKDDAAESDQDNDDSGEDVLQARAADDDDLPNDWHVQDDDDMISVTSAASEFSGVDAASPTRHAATLGRLGVVIEDSDWDDAELLE